MQDKILEKMGIEPRTPESFRIFIASLKTILRYSEENSIESLKTWNAPVLVNLGKLSSEEIKYIESMLPKVDISITKCQVEVQKLFPQDMRKRFAAYYTIDQAMKLMVHIAQEYIGKVRKEKVILADPFLGSARTLTAAIKEIGIEKFERIWGIEPLSLAALVAYASLLDATGGRKDIITVKVGDAFEEIPQGIFFFTAHTTYKADIILTNPPFTRWKYLQKKYRDRLLELMGRLGYKSYLERKEVSLQTLSMFLSDFVLNDGGLIVSVLPASTFYTIYGRGYKLLLRRKYEVLGLVESISRASFSEDSGFKEVIIAAVKSTNIIKKPTVFAQLNNNAEEIAEVIFGMREPTSKINSFNIYDLPRFLDNNWLALFGENKLRDLVVDIFEEGLRKKTLGYWKDIMGKKSIIRGVEMYGPEFFFIPNKYWLLIKEDKNSIEIENIKDRTRLLLPKEFLVKTLRKPSLYSNMIEATVNTYMLSLPPLEMHEFPRDIQEYINWGIKSNTAKPAIQAYGRYWYSHVYEQMKTKLPFGQVFLPDKVDLSFKNRGVFANYTRDKVAASKNFYIIKCNNEKTCMFLVGWFNSTIFLSTLVLLSRKISETWTRFLENDYLELPVINITNITEEKLLSVFEKVTAILDKKLPPLWDQFKEDYRRELDIAMAEIVGLNNPLETLEKLYGSLLDIHFNK
ncbi:MAG: hypothetical protein LM573_05450 [Thermofilum sp.]|nr:hypothetical protein [Thermofilum sp.]